MIPTSCVYFCSYKELGSSECCLCSDSKGHFESKCLFPTFTYFPQVKLSTSTGATLTCEKHVTGSENLVRYDALLHAGHCVTWLTQSNKKQDSVAINGKLMKYLPILPDAALLESGTPPPR